MYPIPLKNWNNIQTHFFLNTRQQFMQLLYAFTDCFVPISKKWILSVLNYSPQLPDLGLHLIYIYMCVCVYVCMYVCVCVWHTITQIYIDWANLQQCLLFSKSCQTGKSTVSNCVLRLCALWPIHWAAGLSSIGSTGLSAAIRLRQPDSLDVWAARLGMTVLCNNEKFGTEMLFTIAKIRNSSYLS